MVVLQQGPSSLPENQEHLREWNVKPAAEIRAAGGQPALYIVWPSRDRLPDTMVATTPGLPPVELTPEVAEIFGTAVEEAVAAYGRWPEG